jgi:hypothetical protein
MTGASFQPAHLRYNPHETLAAFQARQRHAYQAGKAAWREGRINAQALQLYEELVRYVGANTCAWVKEETLASELGRSVSTIKRWMQQLALTCSSASSVTWCLWLFKLLTSCLHSAPACGDGRADHGDYPRRGQWT